MSEEKSIFTPSEFFEGKTPSTPEATIAEVRTARPMGFPLESSGQLAAQTTPIRESVKVLQECVDLQMRKSQDYQNPNSNVTQAMHYRRGIDSIHDIMQGKLYRAQSLLESNTHTDANFESLEDSYKDLINYASFAVAWLRGKMEGQDPTRDIFNKKKPR